MHTLSINNHALLCIHINNNSLLYINTNNHALLLNTDINKHKVKHIITAYVPIFIIKVFLLFFFTVYKNEWKEHKF